MRGKVKRKPRGREKPIPADIRRLARYIHGLRRLEQNRNELSTQTIKVLDWVEKDLVGPELVRHAKHGMLGEVVRALNKIRAPSDSQKHIGAAILAFLRETGQYPKVKELMDKLRKMLPPNCVPPERTVRYITKQKPYHLIAPAKADRGSAKKRVN
jgi:hypothetical protein